MTNSRNFHPQELLPQEHIVAVGKGRLIPEPNERPVLRREIGERHLAISRDRFCACRPEMNGSSRN